MLVVCLELAISNRIVVFQLFPRTKLGKTVLQMTVLYITGPHSRRFGLKTPPSSTLLKFISLCFLRSHMFPRDSSEFSVSTDALCQR